MRQVPRICVPGGVEGVRFQPGQLSGMKCGRVYLHSSHYRVLPHMSCILQGISELHSLFMSVSCSAFVLGLASHSSALQSELDCRHKSRARHKKLLICEIKSHLPRCNQHKHCVYRVHLATSAAAVAVAATKKKTFAFWHSSDMDAKQPSGRAVEQSSCSQIQMQLQLTNTSPRHTPSPSSSNAPSHFASPCPSPSPSQSESFLLLQSF